MKKSLILIIFMIMASVSFGYGQQTVTITVEDLQKFNTAITDRDSYKAQLDEAKAQLSAWKEQAGAWKLLYQEQTKRADVTQEDRVTACNQAKDALGKEVMTYKIQASEDRIKIGQLTSENDKLRSNRKYYFLTGLGVGGLGGAYLGYKFKPLP